MKSQNIHVVAYRPLAFIPVMEMAGGMGDTTHAALVELAAANPDDGDVSKSPHDVTKAVSLLSIANNYCDLQSLKDRIKNHLADVLENVESAKYYAGTLKIPTSLDLELMPPEELKQDVGSMPSTI